MGLLANYPIALAPGMGHNVFFAFTLCSAKAAGLAWQESFASPALGDIDNDGIVEIVLATGGGDVICFSCNGKYNPELLPWPCRLFDSRQSGWLR